MSNLKKLFLFAVLGMFLLVGCDLIPGFKSGGKKPAANLPPAGAIVVAKVGNFYITADDLNNEVKSYNSMMDAQGVTKGKIDTREKKIAYLRNEMVRKYVLYQEALDRGIDKKDDVVHSMEEAKVALLVSELVKQEMDKIEITDTDVTNFYNQKKDLLKEPEQRKLLEIVSSSEGDAKQIYIELLKGTEFADMARQFSKAPSASKGGDLGWVTIDVDPAKRTKSDTFYQESFSPLLEKGGISKIFKTQDGNYNIVKVVDIKKSEAKPLSELRAQLKEFLTYDKKQAVIIELSNKLSAETKTEIFEGKVD